MITGKLWNNSIHHFTAT